MKATKRNGPVVLNRAHIDDLEPEMLCILRSMLVRITSTASAWEVDKLEVSYRRVGVGCDTAVMYCDKFPRSLPVVIVEPLIHTIKEPDGQIVGHLGKEES